MFNQSALTKSINNAAGIPDEFTYTTSDDASVFEVPGYFAASRFLGVPESEWEGGTLRIYSLVGSNFYRISADGLTITALSSSQINTGSYYYSDTGVPKSLTSAAGWSDIPNDTLGDATVITYGLPGLTDVWFGGSVFDWRPLALGDMLVMRVDLTVDILSNNTRVAVRYTSAGGALNIFDNWYPRTGVFSVSPSFPTSLIDPALLNNNAKFEIIAETDCNYTVLGFSIQVTRRG